MKKNTTLVIFVGSILVFVLIGCFALYLLGTVGGDISPTVTDVPAISNELEVSMNLTSFAFAYGQSIPPKYSCKGENVSPPLTWDEPPAGTQSFALIMDDPDAPMGTWVHWVLFNIPAATRGLSEAMPGTPTLTDGSLQGVTSAHGNGYHGPCPPSGTHRYFFKLYALNIALSLSSDADKKVVLSAIEGHILAQAELMGTFSK